MRKVDVFAGVGLLVFVAVMAFIVVPRENVGGIWHGLSPYFYPMVMLGGIALGSVGLLVQALTKPKMYEDQPNPITWEELGFFLLIGAIVFAGVLIIHRFGMWVGGPLLIAATMIFMGELRPVRIALVALLTVAATHLVIAYALQIPLP